MTRQYWTFHQRHEGLQTNNQHIASLIINNFKQPEIPIQHHIPYMNWKKWLEENPIRKPRDK